MSLGFSGAGSAGEAGCLPLVGFRGRPQWGGHVAFLFPGLSWGCLSWFMSFLLLHLMETGSRKDSISKKYWGFV